MLIAWLAGVGALAGVAAMTYAVQRRANASNAATRRQAPLLTASAEAREAGETRALRRGPQL